MSSQKSNTPQNNKYKKYIDTLNLYYSLKNDYETKIKTKKNKIIRSNDTIENKKKLIQILKEKVKCINCKKKGGTLFTQEDNILKATCNAAKKCKLNIEINKSENIYIPKYLEGQNNEEEAIKKEITQYKLDLLFGLESEEVVTQEFKVLREKFKETTNIKNTLLDIYDQQNNNMYMTILKNTDDKDIFIWKYNDTLEDKDIPIINLDDILDLNLKELIINPETENMFIPKKKYLEYLNLGYNKLLSVYNEYINNYKKTNEIAIINDSLELYKTKILPLLDFIRFIKHPVIFIDKQSNASGFSKKLMPTFHFKSQLKNKQKEMIPTDYNIISNKK